MQQATVAMFEKSLRRVCMTLHGALLAMSVAVVLLPPTARTELVRSVFYCALFAACAAGMLHSWRLGFLRLTPRQLSDRVRSDPAARMPLIEKVALPTALVAFIVLW